MKSYCVILILTLICFVRSDDVEDNQLAPGEEIILDDVVGEGQIDNMDVQSAGDDKEEDTATYEIDHEAASDSKNHLHVTFRQMYVAKEAVKEQRRATKKTPEQFFEDLILPTLELKQIQPLDAEKPLLSLVSAHKNNINFEYNFNQTSQLNLAVKELKKLKEVLVIEFVKPGKKGGHTAVWGLQANEKEIEKHSKNVMHKDRTANEKKAD